MRVLEEKVAMHRRARIIGHSTYLHRRPGGDELNELVSLSIIDQLMDKSGRTVSE